VDCGININCTIWDLEFAGGELFGLNIGDFDLVGLGGSWGIFEDSDCDQDIGCYCHRENGVEGVVDVLANDIDSAWRTGHELCWMSKIALELLQEGLPSCGLTCQSIFSVDVLEGLCDWYRSHSWRLVELTRAWEQIMELIVGIGRENLV